MSCITSTNAVTEFANIAPAIIEMNLKNAISCAIIATASTLNSSLTKKTKK